MNKDKHWLSNEITNLAGSAFFREENEPVVNVIELRKLVEQLDEPKLPVIPQFVADWIEECKARKHNLFGVYQFSPEVVSDWIFENESKKERIDLIARAWLSKEGYTVEKEKLYYLKLKEDLAEQMLLTRHKYLNVLIGKIGQAYTFDDKMGYSSCFKTKLTKEEVEIWKNKLNELEFEIVEVTE